MHQNCLVGIVRAILALKLTLQRPVYEDRILLLLINIVYLFFT